jgi:hypothetical protein
MILVYRRFGLDRGSDWQKTLKMNQDTVLAKHRTVSDKKTVHSQG